MPPKFDPSLIPPFPTLTYEKQIAEHGCTLIAGLDEAGRGALAGPAKKAGRDFRRGRPDRPREA